jgi:nucleotide-binding universal stress UspA family protein
MSDAHVVVGHDGHAGSEVALAAAVDLAGRIGAHLHVVHAVTLADYGVDPDTEAFEETRDRNLTASRDAIADALAGSPVSWTYHEANGGDPAARLAELAEQTDAAYIVVGASHRRLLHLDGSVSKRLLHLQTRPVVVIPDPEAVRHHHGRRTASEL